MHGDRESSQATGFALSRPCVYALCSLLALAALTGCQKGAPTETAAKSDKVAEHTRAPIAVIDLNRLVSGIGATDKIREAISQTEHKLVSDLIQSNQEIFPDIAADTWAEFNTVASKKIDSLAPDQKKSLLRDAQSVQSQLVRRQIELRDKFYREVSEIAFQVAQEQGYDALFTTGQIMATTNEHDITDKVISRINQNNQSAAVPPKTDKTATLPGGGDFPIR